MAAQETWETSWVSACCGDELPKRPCTVPVDTLMSDVLPRFESSGRLRRSSLTLAWPPLLSACLCAASCCPPTDADREKPLLAEEVLPTGTGQQRDATAQPRSCSGEVANPLLLAAAAKPPTEAPHPGTPDARNMSLRSTTPMTSNGGEAPEASAVVAAAEVLPVVQEPAQQELLVALDEPATSSQLAPKVPQPAAAVVATAVTEPTTVTLPVAAQPTATTPAAPPPPAAVAAPPVAAPTPAAAAFETPPPPPAAATATTAAAVACEDGDEEDDVPMAAAGSSTGAAEAAAKKKKRNRKKGKKAVP